MGIVRFRNLDHYLSMSPEIAAIVTLVITLILAVVVDRGVPNILESIAFVVEDISRWIVAMLRRSARGLRERHRSIEVANQKRMAGLPVVYEPVKAVVSSGSTSVAA
jgi:hypothetical protein